MFIKTLEKSERTKHSTAVIITVCLLSLLFMSAFYYGNRVVIISFISVAACYVADQFCIYLRKGKFIFHDYSSLITGLTLALLMPASIPYDMLVIACLITIVIGKQIFGGVENPVFSPVAVGFGIVALCWKDIFLMYPSSTVIEQLGMTSDLNIAQFHSLGYYLNMGVIPSLYNFDILLGSFNGPMGTSHLVLLLVVAFCLIVTRSASGITILSCLGTLVAGSLLFPLVPDVSALYTVLFELMSGATLFVLLFVACDYSLSPQTRWGRLLYGILIAVLTMFLRRYSLLEVGVIYAVIIANALSSTMDGLAVYARKIPPTILRFMKFIAVKISITINKLISHIKSRKDVKNKKEHYPEEENQIDTNQETLPEQVITEDEKAESDSLTEKEGD